jgi:hypothetical protein
MDAAIWIGTIVAGFALFSWAYGVVPRSWAIVAGAAGAVAVVVGLFA